MKSSLACSALAFSAVAILMVASLASADDVVVSSCPEPCNRPPRDSAHLYIYGFRTEAFPYALYPGLGLRSAKPGRALVVDATMSNVTPTVPITFQMHPVVNGTSFDSLQTAAIDCGGRGTVPLPSYCSTTARWWLDLDQHPELLGGPLGIALIVGTEHQGGQDPLLAVNLTAHLERK